jgi:DNA-binding NarL/FixJ family response regulator
MAQPQIRIITVSRAPLIRAGLRALLEPEPSVTIVGEADSPAPAIKLAETSQPDVILVDVLFDPQEGVDAIPQLLAVANRARILVIGGRQELSSAPRVVEFGASGFVLHQQCADLLMKAIAKVHTGELWLDRSTTAAVVNHIARRQSDIDSNQAKIGTLTRREREIVEQIGEGLNNKHISERLFISEATVRNHLTSVLAKLELSNRFELAVYAYRHSLVRSTATPQDDGAAVKPRRGESQGKMPLSARQHTSSETGAVQARDENPNRSVLKNDAVRPSPGPLNVRKRQ